MSEKVEKQRVGNFNRSIGCLTHVERTDNGLHLQTETENIIITVYSAHIVRVRIYLKSFDKPDFSYAVVEHPGVCDISFEENKEEILLLTPALKVMIKKKSF